MVDPYIQRNRSASYIFATYNFSEMQSEMIPWSGLEACVTSRIENVLMRFRSYTHSGTHRTIFAYSSQPSGFADYDITVHDIHIMIYRI